MDLDATEPKELIAVRGVSFAYEGVPVLKDVDLSIRKGDFLALIGPNGSGKTTLIKVILGLLKPDRGDVVILGQAVGRFRDRHKIGYIPQKATHVDPLFPASVREVVAMALLSSGRKIAPARKKREAAIAGALEQVGMESFLSTPVGSLSGGQQQRVFIARALVTHPEILFLDEPTSGVDPLSRRRFFELIGEMRSQGITVFVTTHVMDEAELCTRVALVRHGLIAIGTPTELKRRVEGSVYRLRVDHPGPAFEAIQQRPEVADVSLVGGALHVRVHDPSVDPRLWATELPQIGVTHVAPAEPTLETVFLALMDMTREGEGEAP